MKPKTIRDLLKDYGICKCGTPTDSPNFAYHICIEQGLLFQIQQLLEECAPEKQYKQDEAWRIAVNKTIDQYKSNIRRRLK